MPDDPLAVTHFFPTATSSHQRTVMHTYDIDQLYASAVDELLVSRSRSGAIGGANNIRQRGDGPERAVRRWIAAVIGNRYRVTHGHVVRADGRKSQQVDVIVVRDVPIATLYPGDQDDAELVRAECVAAVGEVKSSWYDHHAVIRGYGEMLASVRDLQGDLLVRNSRRFGELRGDTLIAAMAAPVSGREYLNPCYGFVLALGFGKCRLARLATDMASQGVAPRDGAALLIDGERGGAICMPVCQWEGRGVLGVQCDFNRRKEHADIPNCWETLQDPAGLPARTSAGRLLNLFVADLQMHLSTWHFELRDPRPYVRLSDRLRRRHPREQRGT